MRDNPSYKGESEKVISGDADIAAAIISDLDIGLLTFSGDVESFAWACETLWISEFNREQDNEHLSRFPVGLLRLMAIRSRELSALAERLSSLDIDIVDGRAA